MYLKQWCEECEYPEYTELLETYKNIRHLINYGGYVLKVIYKKINTDNQELRIKK